MSRNQYFATLKGQELLSELVQNKNNFHRWIERSGMGEYWRRSYDLYYGKHVMGQNNGTVQSAGSDGELSAFGINYYRNFVRHVLALTCSQKPAYDFRAVNSDSKSGQQARLATNIIDSYLVEKRLGRHQKLAAEKSLVFKVGYTYTTWDPSQGKPYSVDEKQNEAGESVEKIIYEGDADISSPAPWKVTYDPSLRDWTKNKWVEVEQMESRFDLAARHPEMSEQVLGFTNSDTLSDNYTRFKDIETTREDEKSDLIPVNYFYHLPTDSLPGGKFCKYVGNDILLYEGPYQYKKKLPVQRITPGEKPDSAEGYSEFADIMVLQQVVNIICSSAFTNLNAFGVQSIWLPEGCTISTEQLGQGLAVLKGGLPGTKPEALQLAATPMEAFKFLDYIEKAMEKLIGINSVVRGDPDHSLKSGVALGRLQAMAIQFSSNFQQAWAELQEDVGTFLLYILQDYAKTDRMVAIAGKFNKSAMKSFTGKDLDLIDRVVCDLGNPLSRTFAGRMELADKLFEKGEINGKQYIGVIQTGQIESSVEGPQARLELARKENEMLQDGQRVSAMVGDMHILHSQEHGALLADPDLRSRANAGEPEALEIVQNVLDHLLEHKQLHETQEAFYFTVSGEQPPPPQMPEGPPPMGPEGQMPPPMPQDQGADPGMMAPIPGDMPPPPPIPPMPEGMM